MADTICADAIAGLLGIWDGRFDSHDAGGGAEIACAGCRLLREGYAQVAGLGAVLSYY